MVSGLGLQSGFIGLGFRVSLSIVPELRERALKCELLGGIGYIKGI